MPSSISKSSDASVFGGFSMKVVADNEPLLTDLTKTNLVDLSGLDHVCISAYIRMFSRSAGSFVARVMAYNDLEVQLGHIDWTVLTSSGQTEFTRYYQAFDMTALGEAGQLPVGTRYIKVQFGWDGPGATGTAYVDGVKAEPGSTPTAWTPYQLKENDSFDLVADGTIYKKVKNVGPDGRVTRDSIAAEAIGAGEIEDDSISGSKIAAEAIDLGYHSFGQLPNTHLAKITDPSKIDDGLLAETKLDTGTQGKLSALLTNGKVVGPLVKTADSATLIDTTTGRVTSELKTSAGTELDAAVENAANLHSRAIAEPHEENGVLVGDIHDAGGGVYTYRLSLQAAGAAVNIGEAGDSLAGLFDLLDNDGGDLLDANGDPVEVTGIFTDNAGTPAGEITPGDTQPGAGLEAGWWLNDGVLTDSTVYIKLSALPAGTVTKFDALYSKRNTIGNLGRNSLVKKAVVSGEADPDITNTILDLKGTGDWNTPVPTGRKLIELTDSNGKIAASKVVESSLSNGAVTTDKLGAGAVTSDKIGTAEVGSDQLGSGAVLHSKLAPSAVTTDKLDNLAVTNEKLGQLSVSTPKLADNAVNQAKIRADAVGSGELINDQGSLAKVTNNMLQRDVDGSIKLGSGVPLKHAHDDSIVITDQGLVGTGKVNSGSLQSGSVIGDKIDSGAVGTGHLADDAVTQAKIGDSAIGSAQLANGSVVAGKIGAGVVGSSELASNSVTETKVQDGAVTAGKIGTGAVTSDKINAGAVTTSKLGDDAVTQSKIGPAAVGTSELGDQAVSTSKIGLGAVATDRLSDQAVSTGKLANGAVDNTKLAANSVSVNELQDGAVNASKLATGAVTKDKVHADVFSELATTNLVQGGSFENGVW